MRDEQGATTVDDRSLRAWRGPTLRPEEDHPSLQVALPPTVHGVGTARRLVREFLARTLDRELLDVVTLLTSELVTNAVVHADTPYVLDVAVGGDWLRVAVRDQCCDPARRTDRGEAAESGRGMQLVAAFAADWGTVGMAAGKEVWFEIEVSAGRRR